MLLLLFCPILSQSQSSADDLKKQAEKLFEDEAFTQAYPFYSQLVANFPKDPEYNYRLGVCMIYSEPDKKKCIPFLKIAAANPKDAPKDVTFYLGKAYHINYLFDEAIKYYNEYKKIGSAARQKKLQVDREIKACSNGKLLLSNLSDLVVQNKKELNESDYFRSYDLKDMGGKLLVKPDDFKTPYDKKKKEKSIVFLPKGSNVVYYSSYGEKGETGKDIYTVAKQADGTFSKPQKVTGINTEFDEDFPFLHPDGKTLYFASKGHNGMGGYDIFKSTFNEETNAWSNPVNLEFPINSPDDDYLFVTDSLEKTAYFSTGRQSPPGKIDVLKINTVRKPIDVLVILGKVGKETEEQSVKSVLKIKNLDSNAPPATFEADENGDYELELPNGAHLSFTVETPGQKTQTEEVRLPLASTSKPFKQAIAYESGVLKIMNQFDEGFSEDTYLRYLKVIEKKAKLEVNEGTNTLPTLSSIGEISKVDTSTKVSASVPKKQVKPQLVEEETAVAEIKKPNEPKTSVDNKQLALLAKQDAEEARQEVMQLERDAKDANNTGLKQKEEASKKIIEAEEQLKIAETLTNEEEKSLALGKAIDLKQSAETELAVAEKIVSFSKSLENDAKKKQIEYELNQQYSKELEATLISKNNTTSAAKLEELQKRISSLEDQKIESEQVLNDIKIDIEKKESQVSDAERTISELNTGLQELNTELNTKEEELTKARKKTVKENLTNQVNTLKNEKKEKETELSSSETTLKKLNLELNGLKNGLDLATKIKSEDLTTIPPPAVAAAPVKELAPGKVTAKSLEDSYKEKIKVNEPSNKINLERSNTELKNYNSDIDKLITKEKTELTKTKNAATKTQLTNDIKALETTKKQNQQLLATNSKQLQNINAATSNTTTSKDNITAVYTPISASNGTEAINKLETLDKNLTFSDNDNFDFNGYQNPEAQSQKVAADARINDAVARQKKLKEEIQASREFINKNKNAKPFITGNVVELNKESEDLHSKAVTLLQEARTKEGAEKEKLMAESKTYEEQSNEKHLIVAEITGQNNVQNFENNKENIQNLVALNKTAAPDLAESKRLNEEAELAFKKASEIRSEVASLTNNGAKLGNFSNAEEKEAEALLKQQQALDILIKGNPDYVPIPLATNTESGTPGFDLNTKIEEVNASVKELAEIKIDSYQKLQVANETELQSLNKELSDKQNQLENNPRLKTEFLNAGKRIENAALMKQKAEATQNSVEKLSALIASVKEQQEALKQYNKLNTELTTVASKNSGPTNNTTTPTEPTTNTLNPETSSTPKEEVKSGTESIGETTNTTAKNALEITITDSTSTQVVTYFQTNTPVLKNPQADTQVKNSISQLSAYENELKIIDEQTNTPVNTGPPQSSGQLKDKSDTLTAEAENMSTLAFQYKKEAETKSGEEKDALIRKSKELDSKALDKSIEAADLLLQSTEIEVQANQNGIVDMIALLKTDDPGMAEQVAEKNRELVTLRNQIQRLRKEGDTNPSRGAKLGAYSNAEEREVELLEKQNLLLLELKTVYPNYDIKPLTSNDIPKPGALSAEQIIQKKKAVQEKQYGELTNLTNAFSLEYESSKNAVPKTLNPEQVALKAKADDLNAESKRLLIQSTFEKNETEKMKMLTLAARSGNLAVSELSKLATSNAALATNKPPVNPAPEKPVKAPAVVKPKNPPVAANNPPVNPPVEPAVTTNNAPTVRVDGLEVIKGNAYNENRPIPINAKIEDGLVFRVQIGAFKIQLPNNAFRGLSPLNAESTANGYYRYTAGNFGKYENANAVKNDLRGLGYSDAFIVAYYNGKRITLAEAMDLLAKEGKTIDATAPQTAGITANVNIPRAAVNTAIQTPVQVSRELEKINGLLFTIQIGVYNKQVSKQQLLSLRPISTELLPSGLYRFTAGIYNNIDRLLNDKRRVIDLGIKDAFVSAYLNGKKIPFAEAKDKQANDQTIKMETEDPIVFPNGTEAAPTPNTAAANNAPAPQIFNNGVTNYPQATVENGVKTNEEGLCFKVQVGAYTKQVPADVAAKLSSIKTWPVDFKQVNALYIYNIGNFTSAKFAKTLKEEAIRLGLTDAFITVYRDGKKLYGAEAAAAMNQ